MSHRAAVVVGLGDSRDDIPELSWAAREAALRDRPLHIIRAYNLAARACPWDNGTDRMITAELRAAALHRLEAAQAAVSSRYPELDTHVEAVPGVAWEVLGAAAETAELTVVGSHGRGALGSTLLGSVSTVVAARGPGPIVVAANPPGDPAENPAVVVGVDGSPGTDDVLDFAFDYASLHGSRLHAVYCWHPDLLAAMAWRGEPPAPERADRWLAEATGGWQEKYPDVRVSRGVLRALPVWGLVNESLSRELLVVGSHSRHPRVSAFLGSTSQGVLHHASCPVAVVHARAGRAE